MARRGCASWATLEAPTVASPQVYVAILTKLRYYLTLDTGEAKKRVCSSNTIYADFILFIQCILGRTYRDVDVCAWDRCSVC